MDISFVEISLKYAFYIWKCNIIEYAFSYTILPVIVLTVSYVSWPTEYILPVHNLLYIDTGWWVWGIQTEAEEQSETACMGDVLHRKLYGIKIETIN